MTDKLILMPETITAENGAKAALNGEFKTTEGYECVECGGSGVQDEEDEDMEPCEICDGKGHLLCSQTIEWTTIKDIYKKAVECCQLTPSAIKEMVEIDFIKTQTPEQLNQLFNSLSARIKELENKDDK